MLTNEVIATLDTSNYCCVICQNGGIVAALRGIGVRPIITTLDKYPQMLRGSIVADKVIGKAAAMLLVKAGVSYVYGRIMSTSAQIYLQNFGVDHSYGTLVPKILNRTQTGLCPMEQSVLDIEDANLGILEIRKFIAKMMAKQQ